MFRIQGSHRLIADSPRAAESTAKHFHHAGCSTYGINLDSRKLQRTASRLLLLGLTEPIPYDHPALTTNRRKPLNEQLYSFEQIVSVVRLEI